MKKRILAIVLLVTMLIQAPMVVQAADTVFMVPEISATWDPPGLVWKSPFLDAQGYMGSGGFLGDIINNRGLKAAVADLNANVSAGDYKLSILGIYPEGEALTDEIMQMIAAEGWTRIEVYYPTFEITGSPQCAGMTPSIAKTEDAGLTGLLTNAGYTNQVATVKIEGITMSDPWTILYEPEFGFLSGQACTMYKYLSDIQKFVPGPTVDVDGYKKYFYGMENLTTVDGDPNGTYIIATATLPAELVITAAEIQPLRDELKQQEEEKANEAVAWTFANGDAPENFTAEAKVEVKSEKEVKVDFEYSGELPEGTQVTIDLPADAPINKDGETLYFYYYDSEIDSKEFVSEGIVKEGKVTFAIEHCSEYIITTEKPVTDEVATSSDLLPDLLPIIGVFVAVVTITIIKKKQRSH